MRISYWSSDVCSSDLVGPSRKMLSETWHLDRRPPLRHRQGARRCDPGHNPAVFHPGADRCLGDTRARRAGDGAGGTPAPVGKLFAVPRHEEPPAKATTL